MEASPHSAPAASPYSKGRASDLIGTARQLSLHNPSPLDDKVGRPDIETCLALQVLDRCNGKRRMKLLCYSYVTGRLPEDESRDTGPQVSAVFTSNFMAYNFVVAVYKNGRITVPP